MLIAGAPVENSNYGLSHKLSIFLIISLAHCTDAAINWSVRGPPCGPPKKIVRHPHVQARQNRGHDADHALAALVHLAMLQLSSFLRHKLVQIDLSEFHT